MRQRSNNIPLPRIRVARAKDEQYRNDRHQEIGLDQSNPDHGIRLHETEWPSTSDPANGGRDGARQRNQRQDRAVDPQ